MSPEDKPALMEIAARIWEGSDYLPAVFDEWVADTRGEFAAVFLGGRLAGCAKLTFLTDTDAWLEGLRKDPQVTKTGLGRAVSAYFLSLLAARRDLTSIRLATYVKNRASIATSEHLGFRVRTVLSVKAWRGSRIDLAGAFRDRASRPPSQVSASTIRDERAIADFLEGSSYFTETQGLLAEGWRVYPYTPARFVRRYAAAGACRGIVRGGALAGLAAGVIGRRPGRTGVKLVFLDAADDETAGALLADAACRLTETPGNEAEEGGVWEIEWIVPPGERFRRWSAVRGLVSREQESDFLVYEFPLDELGRYAAGGEGATP
jgi:RimJ/RimL family protein N-acetyltransferase